MNSKMYDAIMVGGGPSGRFGACFIKALGGEPLIIENANLGGQCPKNRCAFENFIWEQASMAEMMRLFSGKSWYPNIDLSNISQWKAVEMYNNVGQKSADDAMDFQTEVQLKVDVVRGDGKVIDKNTVEVNGKVYKGKSLVIATGSRATIPEYPWYLSSGSDDLRGARGNAKRSKKARRNRWWKRRYREGRNVQSVWYGGDSP